MKLIDEIEGEDMSEWIKAIIMLQVLKYNGGVAILNNDLLLTEGL